MIKIEILKAEERKKIAQSKQKGKGISTFSEEVDGRSKNLNVYDIPIEALVYRLNNTRTLNQQLSHIKKNGLNPNYFSNGQEDEEAHNVQHKILFNMVTSSGEDENIYEELKEIKKFDLNNPLVVTNDLMVINGNRRLSSLRELYYSNKGDYPNFSKIPCAIDYDDLTEKDIGMREVYHQMKKDFKADYDWINRGMFIRKLLNEPYLLSEQDIGKHTRLKMNEIDNLKRALALAEEYLEETNDKNNFDSLSGQEQIWMDKAKMQKQNSKSNPKKWFIQNHLSKKIVSQGNNLKKEGSGRLYDIHKKLCDGDGPLLVVDILKKKYGNKIKEKKDEVLDILGKPVHDKWEQAASDFQQMLPHIKDKALDAKKLLEFKEEVESNKDEGYIEEKLNQMLSTLTLIDSKQIPTNRFPKIKKLVSKLKEKIDKYSKKFDSDKLN
tara:strand:- start:986 stop:2299 length:1314 start_codon:yes stop_codon:yes gene_type:complete